MVQHISLVRRTCRVALAAVLIGCGHDATEPAGFGTILISVVTSGGDADVDGYVVTLDGSEHVPIAPIGSRTLQSVASGSYLVGLTGVAPNCLLLGAHPVSVRVSPGRSLTVRFDVRCSTTGIDVAVRQAGFDFDEDGFTFTVDGAPAATASPAGTTRIGRLSPGPHTIAILGVAGNCSVDEGETRTVTVSAGQVTLVEFTLTCQAVSGAIEITTVTTGEDLDPDGYILRVGSMPEQVVGHSGVALVRKLPPGPLSVRLDGVASSCQVEGDVELTADVTLGSTVSLVFRVTCARTDVIAFSRGHGDDASVAIVHAGGAGPATLSSGGQDPVWSPDGQRLAYRRIECSFDFYYYDYCFSLGLFNAHVQGWSPVPLATGEDGPADWSPDGSTLIFARTDNTGSRLFTVRADGKGETGFSIRDFTGAATSPAWSPDGMRIAFACRETGAWDLCIANADGTGFRRVTDDAAHDFDPAWSPDGTRIAFTVDGGRITVIGADGSGRTEVSVGREPAWSPDGTRLVFAGSGGSGAAYAPGLYLVNTDGSGLVRLTFGASDRTPSWRR